MIDIVVIGSGPAGLTAAIYARRSGKSVVVLENNSFGGQMTWSPRVQNYPGFPSISGNELADKMIEQASELGVEIEFDNVVMLKKNGTFFKIFTDNAEYSCKSVIIASGSKHRTLGLPKEEEFVGKGVSYCALCDGAFYQDKNIAVIGGGNSALQEIILLADIAKHVTVIQNLSHLTGEQSMIELVNEKENVSILASTIVTGLIGKKSLEAIAIESSEHGNKRDLPVDGIFVAIGQKPDNEVFQNVCKLDENGFIVADESCLTSTPGIFAAGDCRTKKIRQIVTACGDGAISALGACRYIDKLSD